MRIAVVSCVYPPYRGGIGHAAQRQSRILLDLGHTVDVFCPADDDALSPLERSSDGISVHRLRPMMRYNNSALIPAVARRVSSYDAVWLHYPFYGGAEWAAIGATLRRKPYVVAFHMDVLADGIRGLALAAYDRVVAGPLLSRARAVVVSSDDYRRNSSLARRRLRNVVELPYGVDTRTYSAGPVESNLLAGLGLDPRRPVILFVGGMDVPHAFKGVPILLQAFAESGLASRAQLALVGDGELRASYERQAAALGVGGAVRFLGRTPEADLIGLYRAATATVLPSTSGEEAFGIVLIEAMACGSAVIASDLPGVRVVVGAGGDARGMLVAPGDPVSLGAAMIRLIDDDAFRETCRRRALVAAGGRFSQESERTGLEKVTALLVRSSLSNA